MLEQVVAREYERLLPRVEGFCGCDMCRDDVLVFALNRLPPRYVAAPRGEIITSVTMSEDQNLADVSMALMDAFRRVNANPRAGHPENS